MKVLVANLESCGVNYQTDYIIDELEQYFEFTKDFKEADFIVMLGGCCCTAQQLNSTIKFINYILDNKKENTKTYLIGCITKGFKNVPELKKIEEYLKSNIDFVIGYYESNKLLNLIKENKLNSEINTDYGICMYNQNEADIFIQNGCTNACSFCKTNYLNCSLKDMPMERIKEIIDSLNKDGIKKIQLRGLNLSQYGLDLYKEYKLMELCEYIEGKSGIEQVILSNFAFSDAIRGNFQERLKYLEKTSMINSSLESGSNRILNLMKKGFTSEEILQFYDQVNSIYGKKFRLNIVSGFPTETVDDCLKTIEVIDYINPQLVNINTYLDSEFVQSHNYSQLTSSEIRQHTKIYSKILKNHSIRYKINGAN